MNKQEFLTQLRKGLSGLPQNDIDERIVFYSEMIDDRIEEGLFEEEAVAQVGSVDEIVAQIIAETPFTKITKERIKPKRQLKTWEIVLLALGSPIWFSLAIAAISVVFSLYVSLWSVVISFWAVFVSLAACSVGGLVASAILAILGKGLAGVAMFSAGLICGGLSIFTFFGCKAATKGVIILTEKIAVGIKNCFIKKEEV
ncbi:MAG: DUF1700 domain-containing protein [Ruminococcus sp.]|nr:DUF1700 domain-containing protein [Ruminococcus sp.]